MLFIKYTIFPEKNKKFNEKKYNKRQSKKKASKQHIIKQKNETEKKSSLLDKISFIKEIISVFLNTFSNHLEVNIKKLHIKIATDDAARTAILYGALSGTVAGIIELIDSYTNLKKLDKCSIIVEPDFLSENCETDINITLSINVLGALVTLSKTFWKYIMLKNQK